MITKRTKQTIKGCMLAVMLGMMCAYEIVNPLKLKVVQEVEAKAMPDVQVVAQPTPTAMPTATPKPKITPVEKLFTPEAYKVREYALAKMSAYFGADHEIALHNLISSESGFRPDAGNPSSGACGLFQAYPCEKMQCGLTYDTKDVDCQIAWGTDYIERRYGNPTNAWKFWESRQPIEGVDVGNWY